MASSKITYRRRRRRGLRGEPLEQRRGWSRLRSPITLRLIIWVGFTIYRIFRLALRVHQFIE